MLKMKVYFTVVFFTSWAVICFTSVISQHDDHLSTKAITAFDDAEPISGQSKNAAENLSKCLCVPYYRCDPGHWDQTGYEHCPRFMYVCCNGSEAVEYATDHDST